MTYRQALAEGSSRLEAGEILFCDTPFLDSAVLLAFAAGLSREQLFARYPDVLSAEIYAEFMKMIDKRLAGFPVSYIRNFKEFYGRDFYVDERVLVPRPDTECIIEKTIELCGNRNKLKVLDLCTGSGCIAITLKLEKPDLIVTASDISSGALEVAERNAKALNADISFRSSNLFDNIDGCFDVIVTNPPYVPSGKSLKMKDSGWPEPALALDGGTDGLDLIRLIINNSLDYLQNKSYLLIEADPDQSEVIKDLMTEAGFIDTEITRDLAGRNRITSGRICGS